MATNRSRVHHPDRTADRTGNLVRSFRHICDTNQLRTIKVLHLRDTVASLLKDLRVPAGDGQAILGHTRISTTLEIYTNADEQARRDALTRLHGTFTTSRAESRGSRGR